MFGSAVDRGSGGRTDFAGAGDVDPNVVSITVDCKEAAIRAGFGKIP